MKTIEEWVAAAQLGDAVAYEELCRRFAPLVHKQALLPHVRAFQEDAAAEGWLALAEAVQSYQAASGVPFAGYAAQRVRYAVWNAFKRERRRWQHELFWQNDTGEETGLGGIEALPAPTQTAETMEAAEGWEACRAAWRELPPRQQLVMQAVVQKDASLTQIAAELGISVQAVHQLKKRAAARLKAAYAGM